MPTQEIVAVGKGDIERKFHYLAGTNGSNNRPIDRSVVKSYGKDIQRFCIAPITLIARNAKSYYIADGQHRITAISENANGVPVMIPATVYTVAEINRSGRTVAQFVSDLNKGRPFTATDRIAVFAEGSEWPAVFERFGLKPEFRGSAHLNWPGVIGGYLLAKNLVAGDGTGQAHRRKTGRGWGAGVVGSLLEETWLGCPTDEIEKTARTMAWWKPAADAAYRVQRVRQVYTRNGIATAILIHAENIDHPCLVDVKSRIVSEHLASCRGLYGEEFALSLLRAINLFGADGREV